MWTDKLNTLWESQLVGVAQIIVDNYYDHCNCHYWNTLGVISRSTVKYFTKECSIKSNYRSIQHSWVFVMGDDEGYDVDHHLWSDHQNSFPAATGVSLETAVIVLSVLSGLEVTRPGLMSRIVLCWYWQPPAPTNLIHAGITELQLNVCLGTV